MSDVWTFTAIVPSDASAIDDEPGRVGTREVARTLEQTPQLSAFAQRAQCNFCKESACRVHPRPLS